MICSQKISATTLCGKAFYYWTRIKSLLFIDILDIVDMDERPYPSEDVFDIVVCDDNVLFKFLDNAVFIKNPLEATEADALFASIPMNPVNCASSTSNNDYAIVVFKKLYMLFSQKSHDAGLVSDRLYNKFNFSKYVASTKDPKIKKHLLEFIDFLYSSFVISIRSTNIVPIMRPLGK